MLQLRTWMVALLLAGLVAGATAQGKDDRASREREQLRRAQASLRDTSAERDTLKAEKAVLAAQQDRLAKDSAAAKAQAATLRQQLARGQADADALRMEVAALKERSAAEATAQQTAAAEREAALQQQLAAVRRDIADRAVANQRLVALLEASTTALREADGRNRSLHAMGLALVDRWRHKTPVEALVQSEALVGVAGVRAEDEAETLRTRLDALLSAPAAGAQP
jgi:hypothetical protein